MTCSPIVARKSVSSGVSMMPGQTLTVRTPLAIVACDERMVQIWLISLEKP